MDTILQTWSPPPELIEYYPGGWHKYDKGDSRFYYCTLDLIRGEMKRSKLTKLLSMKLFFAQGQLLTDFY